MNSSNQSIFNTQRLYIRRLNLQDLEPFHDMQGNPNVMQYIKKTMTPEESKKELKRFIDYYENEDIFFEIWAVIQTKTNSLIGICGVYKNDKSEYEIAYRLREKYWGKGFGKEIAKGLIKYCFEEMHIKELIAYVIKGNTGSTKILSNEMNFVKEFFCKKTNAIELKFQLKSWLIS